MNKFLNLKNSNIGKVFNINNIRSVYVPEGKEVHLWTGSNFQNEKTRFTHTI